METELWSIACMSESDGSGRSVDSRTSRFPDNSTLFVDFGTRLKLDYGDERRRFMLECGRARFTATCCKDRPFEVYAGFAIIRALEGEFEVGFDEDEQVVTVRTRDTTLEVLVDKSTQPGLDQPKIEQVRLGAYQEGCFHADGAWTRKALQA